MQLAELHQKTKRHGEPGWHIVLAVLVSIVLELLLNDKLSFGNKYAIAGLELVLLVLLVVFKLSSALKRTFAIFLIALISIANVVSLYLVTQALFGKVPINGHDLLISSVAIYITNIIMFGLWYWELDNTRKAEPDFLFAQQSVSVETKWKPFFFDYLYISITNATAFSPTDTLPLTHRAKLLMTLQSIVSLITVALVVSRAVNILG